MLNRGCTGSSESTLLEMPHCWKPHVKAHIVLRTLNLRDSTVHPIQTNFFRCCQNDCYTYYATCFSRFAEHPNNS